jgi:hypothetical protein
MTIAYETHEWENYQVTLFLDAPEQDAEWLLDSVSYPFTMYIFFSDSTAKSPTTSIFS